ncbi:hypothetical protein KCP75_05300 [Salmonella enterica subsp. enterica]|nr:hypothetical protein KCP75_05300 [Salmonella enterica subsp. enterica]
MTAGSTRWGEGELQLLAFMPQWGLLQADSSGRYAASAYRRHDDPPACSAAVRRGAVDNNGKLRMPAQPNPRIVQAVVGGAISWLRRASGVGCNLALLPGHSSPTCVVLLRWRPLSAHGFGARFTVAFADISHTGENAKDYTRLRH